MTCVPSNVKKYGNVIIGHGCTIGDFAVLNYSGDDEPEKTAEKLIIGNNCIIKPNVIIYEGASIGDNVQIQENCLIGRGVKIGNHTEILYSAQIHEGSTIGHNSIIGGLICENVKVGNGVRFFGTTCHRQECPEVPWDRDYASSESPPVIEDRVFVGFGSIIVGGITIHKNSYICAGCIVTKDVPRQHIVCTKNGKLEMIYYKHWKGKLAMSRWFVMK